MCTPSKNQQGTLQPVGQEQRDRNRGPWYLCTGHCHVEGTAAWVEAALVCQADFTGMGTQCSPKERHRSQRLCLPPTAQELKPDHQRTLPSQVASFPHCALGTGQALAPQDRRYTGPFRAQLGATDDQSMSSQSGCSKPGATGIGEGMVCQLSPGEKSQRERTVGPCAACFSSRRAPGAHLCCRRHRALLCGRP